MKPQVLHIENCIITIFFSFLFILSNIINISSILLDHDFNMMMLLENVLVVAS